MTSRSYAPYSEQPSISVAISLDGSYFPGVRIENTSYPLTINAAQNALFCCLSEGEKPKALYVSDPNANDIQYWRQEYNVWVYGLDELDEEELSFKPVIIPEVEGDTETVLKSLLDQAVVKNSEFPVSALLLTDDGYVPGVNVECSNWSFGLCAERMALAKAISYGYTDFRELKLHTRYGEFSSPCGACRQVIVEHMPRQPVDLYHADGSRSRHYSSDLLPHSFRSTYLTKKTNRS